MSAFTNRIWVSLALVGVAVVWAGTFVVVKDAIEIYPVFAFLGWRFWIAVIAFLLIFPSVLRKLDRKTIAVGIFAGAFLCLGFVFQTIGLQGTTASRAAFITGMFVVITPLLQALLLRRMPSAMVAIGALIALVGLWFLSGGNNGSWQAGDTSVLVAAFAYSAHIIILGSIGRRHAVLPLTFVQLAFMAVVCSGVSLVTEPIALPGAGSVWLAILFTGVLASAVAFAVQTYAQRHISPARTALILITEPAFGGVFGWLAGDVFTIGAIAGAALILAGMILSEIVSLRKADRGTIVHETTIEGPSVAMIRE
ncbi:MAG: DMT family transporter [Actinobacteria bacterium]|nr:DMT family transporter [Actinomycetota bacterium]